MPVISRSKCDVALWEDIGIYKFSAIPGWLFNYDATIILSSQKNLLKFWNLQLLKSRDHSSQKHCNVMAPLVNASDKMLIIAVVDDKTKLWFIDRDKDKSIKACKDLAKAFIKKMVSKYWSYDK